MFVAKLTGHGVGRHFLPDERCRGIVQWDEGSWPNGLPKKDGAIALSGAGSLDTATPQAGETSRSKNLRIEYTPSGLVTCGFAPPPCGASLPHAVAWVLRLSCVTTTDPLHI